MTIAITNAHVVPIEGEPFQGTVLVKDGLIAAAGPSIDVPQDAAVVDAGGQWLLPGLVDGHSHVGMCEEVWGWAGDDTNEMTAAVTAGVMALDAINPEDLGFQDALSGGITTTNVLPGSANVIGGLCVAISTYGRIVDDMILRQPSGLKAALGENPKRVHGDKGRNPSTRLGIAQVMRESILKAKDYQRKKDKGDNPDYDMASEHINLVLSGQIPLRQHCHRADDAATAFRLAEEFGYELIIEHGTEGWVIADEFAKRNVPVLYGPLMTNRSKVEVARQSYAAPKIYHEAGVDVSIITDHPVIPTEFLVTSAALAVREGLDRDAALRMITINPAKILGLGDKLGSIEVGKRADLALWSNDPLLIESRVLDVWVAGTHAYTFDTDKYEGRIIK